MSRIIPIVIGDSWGVEKREALQELSLCPLPVVAVIEYIQSQCPCVLGKQKLSGGDGGQACLDWYGKHFPRGVVSFKLPLASRQPGKLPDPLYESIQQGTTIYWTRWELNAPDLTLSCHECKEGILKHTRAHLSKTASSVKAVFTSSGRTTMKLE